MPQPTKPGACSTRGSCAIAGVRSSPRRRFGLGEAGGAVQHCNVATFPQGVMPTQFRFQPRNWVELKLGGVKLGAPPKISRPGLRRPDPRAQFHFAQIQGFVGIGSRPRRAASARPRFCTSGWSSSMRPGARFTARSGAVWSPRARAEISWIEGPPWSRAPGSGRRNPGRLILGAVKLGADSGRSKTGRVILGWHDPLRSRKPYETSHPSALRGAAWHHAARQVAHGLPARVRGAVRP